MCLEQELKVAIVVSAPVLPHIAGLSLLEHSRCQRVEAAVLREPPGSEAWTQVQKQDSGHAASVSQPRGNWLMQSQLPTVRSTVLQMHPLGKPSGKTCVV
jgi:hypothetical protein